MDYIVNLAQLVGGFILTAGYLPQIAKTIRTKSVDDISLQYYGLVCLGVSLMELYALYQVLVNHVAGMFLATNTMALACCSTMLFLVAKYRKKK